VTGSDAATLILIAAAAFVLPLVAGRLAMPAVILEIFFGIAAGPVLGLVQTGELLNALAELGFLLLLFLSGFEIDLRVFERQGARPVISGLAVFAATLGASLLATQLLGLHIFVALVLSTTSVGLVVPTLRATRLMATPLGQDTLINALLADFLTLLAVTVVALVIEFGFSLRLFALPEFFLAVAAVLLLVRRAAWWMPERFERLFDADDPDELGIRATLAMMLMFVGLAIVLGIEPILGAFLAGMAFALVFRERADLDRKLTGFAYGFLIPIFFINVGVGFQLDALAEPGAIGFTALLLAIALAVKVIPALLLVLRRHSLRESLAAGTLLSARLSLIIVVARLGVELGVVDAALEAEIILLAAATATISPALFRWLLPPTSSPARASGNGGRGGDQTAAAVRSAAS
jgi:Kef-type K+ transport system membrane component KefB